MKTTTNDVTSPPGAPFEMRFPETRGLDQDEEWFEVNVDGEWKRIRFHDYHEVYNLPGMYEALFHRALSCNSPRKVIGALRDMLLEYNQENMPIRALDVGAGNGMVGRELTDLGAEAIVGVDIIPEAKTAAYRDRPWVYNDYYVADLTDLEEEIEEKIRRYNLNALTCVAALGYGDIPVKAFATAMDTIQTPGWLAFNIKEAFLHPGEDSGFSEFINQLSADKIIRIESYQRYRHRVSTSGQPLYYVAVVAQKLRDLPDGYLEAYE